MDNELMRDFAPQTVEKVERLLDLLEELGEHPSLRGKLALHGGTAINLFMLDIPRLSVDIDVSYIGALNRDVMLKDRPVVERSIAEVADLADEEPGSHVHLDEHNSLEEGSAELIAERVG